MLRARTLEYVELNPGLDSEKADREARRDFREVNEAHLSEKLAQTFKEMKRSYRLRYVVSVYRTPSQQGRTGATHSDCLRI
ncbi:hypothetical protein CSUI_003402 [Cystoisospora suis]|uniref:Uncharacterized protein n=1 Tax=Cystoisospora suis TaxID=483139 RepID=A0A2C6L598_9APIC|nr:hypothetical protein CSUI_003402 [Cystoisospora suis]